jgi:hypothetical protein
MEISPTQFNINQKVWAMQSDRPRELVIVGITITARSHNVDSPKVVYSLVANGGAESHNFEANRVFDSKESLLASL